MQNQLLNSKLFALEKCASSQPNSRSWQNENGTTLTGALTAFPTACFLDANPRNAIGGLRLVDSLAMQRTHKGFVISGNGGMETGPESFATGGMLREAMLGGAMRQTDSDALAQAQIGDYITGSSGTTGTFKKINTGSHSRLGGLPPLTKASAPPGRDSADPGGGPTAS